MIENNYIIIRSEEDNVKIIIKKNNNDETLEILNNGEVIILNIKEDIQNYKIIGKTRIVSKLDQVISGN